MPSIHPSAAVESDSIGEGVSIGEYTIVRPGARIGDGANLMPHVVIDAGVEIGAGTEVQAGSYLGRRPRATGGIHREPTFVERLQIGAGCAIGAHVIVYYDVSIGEDTLVGDHASIREKTKIGARCVVGRMNAIDRDVQIEDGSATMFGCNIVAKTVVGKGVFIAAGVMTTNDNTLGAQGWNEEDVVGIAVEDEARIGANATLLPGVRIGRRAIVGAGSVVTRDVAPGAKVMGVPARMQPQRR